MPELVNPEHERRVPDAPPPSPPDDLLAGFGIVKVGP
jgi:hypothetical protein